MSLSFDNTQIAFQYKDNKELKLAHFLFLSMSSSFITKAGMTMAKYTMKWGLPFEGIIKNTIFKQFCGGENLVKTAAVTEKLNTFKVDVALDYGVEGKSSEADFNNAVQEFIKVIEYAAKQTNVPFIPLKMTGFARFGLLEKIHAKNVLTAAENEEWDRVKSRIDQICEKASKHGLMVLIDAEQSWIQDPVDDLTIEMMEKYNKEKVIVFNTFQMYRHDRLDFLHKSLDHALSHGYFLGAKLVRGAYMEKERERAKQMGYLSPIQPDKESPDRDFDKAVEYCLENVDKVAVFIGTHNESSCMFGVDKMAELEIDAHHNHVFFSQLYGMSDNITFNLAFHGYRASKYLPYGPVKDVIPYLLRRAEENSAISGQTSRELFFIKKEMKRRGI